MAKCNFASLSSTKTTKMSRAPAQVILGLMTVGPASCVNSRITTIDGLREFLSTFKSFGHTILDTARAYPPGASGEGERMLGAVGIPEGLVVDSKVLTPPSCHFGPR